MPKILDQLIFPDTTAAVLGGLRIREQRANRKERKTARAAALQVAKTEEMQKQRLTDATKFAIKEKTPAAIDALIAMDPVRGQQVADHIFKRGKRTRESTEADDVIQRARRLDQATQTTALFADVIKIAPMKNEVATKNAYRGAWERAQQLAQEGKIDDELLQALPLPNDPNVTGENIQKIFAGARQVQQLFGANKTESGDIKLGLDEINAEQNTSFSMDEMKNQERGAEIVQRGKDIRQRRLDAQTRGRTATGVASARAGIPLTKSNENVEQKKIISNKVSLQQVRELRSLIQNPKLTGPISAAVEHFVSQGKSFTDFFDLTNDIPEELREPAKEFLQHRQRVVSLSTMLTAGRVRLLSGAQVSDKERVFLQAAFGDVNRMTKEQMTVAMDVMEEMMVTETEISQAVLTKGLRAIFGKSFDVSGVTKASSGRSGTSGAGPTNIQLDVSAPVPGGAQGESRAEFRTRRIRELSEQLGD
jgi:hypothetical protein